MLPMFVAIFAVTLSHFLGPTPKRTDIGIQTHTERFGITINWIAEAD